MPQVPGSEPIVTIRVRKYKQLRIRYSSKGDQPAKIAICLLRVKQSIFFNKHGFRLLKLHTNRSTEDNFFGRKRKRKKYPKTVVVFLASSVGEI